MVLLRWRVCVQASFSKVEGALWKSEAASSLPSQAVLDHHSSARASAFSIAAGDSYSVRSPGHR